MKIYVSRKRTHIKENIKIIKIFNPEFETDMINEMIVNKS